MCRHAAVMQFAADRMSTAILTTDCLRVHVYVYRQMLRSATGATMSAPTGASMPHAMPIRVTSHQSVHSVCGDAGTGRAQGVRVMADTPAHECAFLRACAPVGTRVHV